MHQIHLRVSAMAGLIVMTAALAGCSPAQRESPATTSSATSTADPSTSPASEAFAQLEGEFGARLGVYGIDTGTGETITYRAEERFAYASTSKALLAGAILSETDNAALDQFVTYSETDLVKYSPITETHLDTGMAFRDVMAAAVQYSDNTAANLMFTHLGGPAALGEHLTGIGDTVTHVDRIEPELNEATPGDIRDTSTPEALATDLREYAFGSTLTPERRELFTGLLKGNTTGANVIRAGVPKGWTVGDKTGTGGYGTRNDIAIIWPAIGAPIVLAVLSSKSTEDANTDDALIAAATAEALLTLRPDVTRRP